MPDAEDAQELNRQFGEEDGQPVQKSAALPWKFVALMVVLIFAMVFSFGDLGRILGFFSLDFLQQSEELSKSAHVQQLKETVVRVKVTGIPPGEVLPVQRSGTGFNISPDGLIVTNHHLVAGATGATVSFPGGKILRAVSWRSYPDADLAVIDVDGEGLPAAEISSQAQPALGEQVVVIGNPLGFPWVVMEGVITDVQLAAGLKVPVVGIDAPIQPGSSGSPVFNQAGQVVAVIFASRGAGGNEKTGLAVPTAYLVR